MTGAVGGQPDVLSSIDVAAQRHMAAGDQQHAADADSPSLLQQQNTSSPSSAVKTVVAVESSVQMSDDGLESSATAASAVDNSLPQQPAVDPSTIPVRCVLVSSKFSFKHS